jgi:16S rRNA (guanine527-N7)-methyltransferase
MSGALPQLIEHQALDAGCPLTARQISQIERYLSLLNRWGQKINLTANPDARWMTRQHLPDTFQLARLVQRDAADCQSYLDAGAGAGSVGIVLHVIRPVPLLTLVEVNGKKCAFLRTVIHQLGLNARLLQSRLEQLEPAPHQLVCSRATWNPETWLELAEPWMAADGRVAVFSRLELPASSGAYELRQQVRYALPDGRDRTLTLFGRGSGDGA